MFIIFIFPNNKELYEGQKKFICGMDFSKWLNNSFIPDNPDYQWMKEVSSKSVKQSIMNAEHAFKRFFKQQGRFPKYKKKNKSDVRMYFVKTDAKTVIACERHRIKIPTLGWVRLKEKGYIPTLKQGYAIKSGTVSRKAGRYYVSVLVDVPDTEKPQLNDSGLGMDLGIKDFVVISNGVKKKNINKTQTVKKLEKKLKREQRCLSRKYEDIKKRRNKKKGEATRQNIQKQVLKVQKLHYRIYPSSKLCHGCGRIKKNLKLSDREYICECGYRADRDFNASLNLRDAITYKIAESSICKYVPMA